MSLARSAKQRWLNGQRLFALQVPNLSVSWSRFGAQRNEVITRDSATVLPIQSVQSAIAEHPSHAIPIANALPFAAGEFAHGAAPASDKASKAFCRASQ